MTDSLDDHAAPADDDPAMELFRWRSHPVRYGGKRLVVVLAFLIMIPVLLLLLYGTFYALLALVILLGSLSSYFLPTDYVLYTGGGELRFLGIVRRFVWTQFRSFYTDRNGVLLSPFTRPSRLENFRGIYLRFDGSKDRIMNVVTERFKHNRSESTNAGQRK